MIETELAWAAGFFDGEGSVGCYGLNTSASRKNPRPFVRITIAQSYDPFVLHRFKAALQVGNVVGPYIRKDLGQTWHYNVYTFEDVRHVARLLWPYLSPVKRKQFNQAFRKRREARRNAVH